MGRVVGEGRGEGMSLQLPGTCTAVTYTAFDLTLCMMHRSTLVPLKTVAKSMKIPLVTPTLLSFDFPLKTIAKSMKNPR